MFNMKTTFPGTTNPYPNPLFTHFTNMVLANMATFENDWELAASLLDPIVQPDYQGFPLIVPAFAQLHMWQYICCTSVTKIFSRKEQQGEDTTLYEKTLKDVRTQMDMLGRIFPGTFKCSCVIYMSRISLMLKDRPFFWRIKEIKEGCRLCNGARRLAS